MQTESPGRDYMDETVARVRIVTEGIRSIRVWRGVEEEITFGRK